MDLLVDLLVVPDVLLELLPEVLWLEVRDVDLLVDQEVLPLVDRDEVLDVEREVLAEVVGGGSPTPIRYLPVM